MRRFLLIIITILTFNIICNAECQHKKFDIERYNRELESAMIAEAKLTSQEAQAFFPVFHEMQQKERDLFNRQRKLFKTCPADDKAALEIIRNIEKNDAELRQLQVKYHTQFLKILPAGKVLKCIKAEEKFRRDIMKRMAERKTK